MSELINYDRAAHKFYKSQNVTGLPLVSWDLFGPYLNSLYKNYSDICVLKDISDYNGWSYMHSFEKELIGEGHVIVVTDTTLNIVHATNNIYAMNGYTTDEILGKTPKIFQGAATCRKIQKHISNAIKAEKPFEATVINYRKDGSTYNCWIKGQPVFNKKGKVVNFIAYEKEVA